MTQTIGMDVTFPNGKTMTLIIEAFVEEAPPTGPLIPSRHVFGRDKGEQFTIVVSPQEIAP